MTTSTSPFPLWQTTPSALGNQPQDIPTLTPYLPEKINPKKTALIVLPGGAYGGLAPHEGETFAQFFCLHHIAAFVLKYRLGPHGYKHPIMLQDAARAVRLLRHRANEFGINPNLIGVIGSSAGGHLAATLLTQYGSKDATATNDPIDQESARPDFGALCYPVITMKGKTHVGSQNNLLGKNPSPELIERLSNETQVTPQTPPTFIWHTWADPGVPVENSLQFADALRKNNVPFDLHVYQKGGHGMGLDDKPPFSKPHPWAHNFLFWLKSNEFIA